MGLLNLKLTGLKGVSPVHKKVPDIPTENQKLILKDIFKITCPKFQLNPTVPPQLKNYIFYQQKNLPLSCIAERGKQLVIQPNNRI